MEELRTQQLSETETAASKPRFGLFSQPPPLAVGDDSHYLSKKAQRDSDGKVITSKRGVYVPRGQRGTLFDAHGFMCSNNQPDEFIEASRVSKVLESKRPSLPKSTRPPFYHIKAKWNEYKENADKRIGAPFASFEPISTKPAASHKNAEGKVDIPPRGILAPKTQKGPLAKPFGDPYPPAFAPIHHPAPVRQKTPEKPTKPFNSQCFEHALFAKNTELYFIDYSKLPEKAKPATPPPKEKRDPFRPSNPSRGPLNRPYPSVDPRTNAPPAQRPHAAASQPKPKFRPTHNGISRPTPSVALLNLSASVRRM